MTSPTGSPDAMAQLQKPKVARQATPLETFITAVVTHPLAMTVKRNARDRWWRLRGPLLVNPPLPSRVESVLFVCYGNICRSPFAAALAVARHGRSGLRVSSAGIAAHGDARPPQEACATAGRYDLHIDAHEPRLLTRDTIADHQVVLAMDVGQLRYLQARYPEFRQRFFLLSLFERTERRDYDRWNIGDPFGRPLAEFETCYQRIRESVRGLFEAIDSAAARG